MKSPVYKVYLGLMLIVILVGSACNLGASTSSAPTPTLEPTQPVPTETTAPTKPPATQTPTAEPSPTEPPPPTKEPTASEVEQTTKAPFELDSNLYVHSVGHFELYPPAGWSAEEDSGSVSFADPTGVGFVYLQVTNVGYEFDGTAFENFVNAREANFFGGYDRYSEVDRQMDTEERTANVVKNLDFDGIPQTIVTFYEQKGSGVYALDFWADADVFDAYALVYDELFASITVDSSKVSNEDLYYWVYDFTGPNNLFTLEMPSSWRYEYSEGENTLVETFYSPDEHAVIQNIAYDEGEAISKSVAGAFALELLRQFYASDIKITDDQVQPDGSERLTWYSAAGDYSGLSFFESRGTTFLLFTTMYDNPYEDIYLDVLNYTISTYTTP